MTAQEQENEGVILRPIGHGRRQAPATPLAASSGPPVLPAAARLIAAAQIGQPPRGDCEEPGANMPPATLTHGWNNSVKACDTGPMTTTNATGRVVRLRLICEAPPTGLGIEFGLQDKAARLQPGVREPDGALRFEADIRVVRAPDGGIRLRGPNVHGSSTAPYLYLSCRAVGSPAASWIFRLKVSLNGVEYRRIVPQGASPCHRRRQRAPNGWRLDSRLELAAADRLA